MRRQARQVEGRNVKGRSRVCCSGKEREGQGQDGNNKEMCWGGLEGRRKDG